MEFTPEILQVMNWLNEHIVFIMAIVLVIIIIGVIKKITKLVISVMMVGVIGLTMSGYMQSWLKGNNIDVTTDGIRATIAGKEHTLLFKELAKISIKESEGGKELVIQMKDGNEQRINLGLLKNDNKRGN